jgi:hypothetical protein
MRRLEIVPVVDENLSASENGPLLLNPAADYARWAMRTALAREVKASELRRSRIHATLNPR